MSTRPAARAFADSGGIDGLVCVKLGVGVGVKVGVKLGVGVGVGVTVTMLLVAGRADGATVGSERTAALDVQAATAVAANRTRASRTAISVTRPRR
jgi:hypothetical protein